MDREEVKQYIRKVYEEAEGDEEYIQEVTKVSDYIIDQEFDNGKSAEDLAIEGIKYFIDDVIVSTYKQAFELDKEE